MGKSSKRTVNNVRGVLFSKADYSSLELWRDAGYPSNVTVRDTPYWLRASGIPITDAVEINGRFVRGSVEPTPHKIRKIQLSDKFVCHTDMEYDEWKHLLPKLHTDKAQ